MRSLEAACSIFGRDHAVEVKRFGYAFEFLKAEVLKIKGLPTRDASSILR